MPSTRDIRRRIKSVKNTAQITKAMQMVAASKMRKAQMAALAGRPYASLMNTMLAEVIAGAGDFQHEFMEHRGGKKRAIIVVSSDKGLAGALNSNLTREVARQEKEAIFIAAGKKRRAIYFAHETQPRGRIYLQGCAVVCGSARHFKVRPGFVPEGRSRFGGYSLHELHFHAGAKAGTEAFAPGH